MGDKAAGMRQFYVRCMKRATDRETLCLSKILITDGSLQRAREHSRRVHREVLPSQRWPPSDADVEARERHAQMMKGENGNVSQQALWLKTRRLRYPWLCDAFVDGQPLPGEKMVVAFLLLISEPWSNFTIVGNKTAGLCDFAIQCRYEDDTGTPCRQLVAATVTNTPGRLIAIS